MWTREDYLQLAVSGAIAALVPLGIYWLLFGGGMYWFLSMLERWPLATMLGVLFLLMVILLPPSFWAGMRKPRNGGRR